MKILVIEEATLVLIEVQREGGTLLNVVEGHILLSMIETFTEILVSQSPTPFEEGKEVDFHQAQGLPPLK